MSDRYSRDHRRPYQDYTAWGGMCTKKLWSDIEARSHACHTLLA